MTEKHDVLTASDIMDLLEVTHDAIQGAQAIIDHLLDHPEVEAGRERSLVATKLDEAELWLARVRYIYLELEAAEMAAEQQKKAGPGGLVN